MTDQGLAPPPLSRVVTPSRVWPVLHTVLSAALVLLVAVASLVSWSEAETFVVLALPLTLTTAAAPVTSAWMLAGRCGRVTAVVGRLALGGTLTVFVLGAIVALTTWSIGFDYVDTAQEEPARLREIGDLGYRTALIGFIALALASTVVGLAVISRGGRRS